MTEPSFGAELLLATTTLSSSSSSPAVASAGVSHNNGSRMNSGPSYQIVGTGVNGFGSGHDGDGDGFFGVLYNTWDVPKICAAVAFFLTQTLGNMMLMGIVW